MISLSQIKMTLLSFMTIAIVACMSWSFFGANKTESLLFFMVGIGLAAFIGVLKWDKYFTILLIATLPFSSEIHLGGFTVHFPTEIIAALLCASFVLRFTLHKEKSNVEINLSNLGLFFFVFTLFLTSINSISIGVSIKYSIVWITYMFIGLVIVPFHIKKKEISVRQLLITFTLSIGILCLYTGFNFGGYNFERSFAPVMARPFFKDHTLLSAFISLFIPIAFVIPMKEKSKSLLNKSLIFFGSIGLILIFLASSRAAWLGILFSLFCYLIIYYKIKLNQLTVLAGMVCFLIWFMLPQIEQNFAGNRYNSDARDSGLKEQALSVTNISSDVSNMERINRWKCALRMFQDRPLLGYGPGTFQFQYLPYQEASEMTRISVTHAENYKDGHGGTAHSEVFLALSEMGITGLMAWIILWISICLKIRTRLISSDFTENQLVYIASFCGLSTYFIHSLFNNFLNIASFGIFFWILVGLLFTPPKFLSNA